ncbi:MAG: ABC transporter ATP-binding protein [Firmicutes bacterium]|nr:ABC transporter ATP-binding protein [Bacillota bacterium]
MIKKLAACVGEYKRDSILAPVFVTLEVVMEVLIPFLMADLIDKGIAAGNMSYIMKCGLILLLFAVISLVFGVLSGAFAARGSAGFAKNLRKAMYDRIQDFSFGNIDRFSTGGLITRLTTDVTNVQMSYMMIIRVAVRSPIMLILALICAVRIHGQLSTVFLYALPVLAVGLYFIMTRTHPVFVKMFKVYDRLNNVVEENLQATRVVKAFVREDHETDKFNDTSKELFDYATKAEKILAYNGPLMNLVVYACMIAISWFGAKFIVGGSLTTGELVSMFTYIMQILMSLMMLSMVFVMIVMARASANRIGEVLSEESDIQSPANPLSEVPDGSVDMENVSFAYAGKDHPYCLKNVDLHIPSGSTVGILGGTGSAKSTLVQLIPRLYDATEGRVLVGGHDVKEYDLETLRNSVAMVLQKNVLFSGTIKENLRWGNENATDAEIKEACILAEADGFISSFPDGYDTHIEQGGTNVSGGQKQRLCIARALLKKPKILIFDDSTSAVDTATDARIRESLERCLPDTTKIIIAQRVASVDHADTILVLDDGELVAAGNHDQLMETCEIYRETALSQKKGGGLNG